MFSIFTVFDMYTSNTLQVADWLLAAGERRSPGITRKLPLTLPLPTSLVLLVMTVRRHQGDVTAAASLFVWH